MTQEHTEKLPQDNLSFVDIIHQIAGQLEELRKHGYGSRADYEKNYRRKEIQHRGP
jgi:hypothetical protein